MSHHKRDGSQRWVGAPGAVVPVRGLPSKRLRQAQSQNIHPPKHGAVKRLEEELMTTPQSRDADQVEDLEGVEDLQAPAETQEQVAGGAREPGTDTCPACG